jgi:tRNA A-37 threonylcarbamoyl transferase component Bud32
LQETIDARFANASPQDFLSGKTLFFTPNDLKAPQGFENVWGQLTEQHRPQHKPTRAEKDRFGASSAVVLLADALDKQHMKKIVDMVGFLNAHLGDDSPVLIFVCHDEQQQDEDDFDAIFDPVAKLINWGIDEVILSQESGIRLAWEVHNRCQVQAKLTDKLVRQHQTNCITQERAESRKEALEEAVHDILWDYLRVRIETGVPQVDWDIEPGVPSQIGDFQVGGFLGEGTSGSEHKILRSNGEASGSVLKVTSKSRIEDMHGLQCLAEQVQVMQTLTELCPHPNITKLYDIFHSTSHLLFEIEDGGPRDLYRHFIHCEQKKLKMTNDHAQAILYQLASGICHLHTIANVVHLDLKPENIIVSATNRDITIKISDFDTARIEPDVPAVGVVGTFPFSAPEVLSQSSYDPYAADVWSVGVVTLEVPRTARIRHFFSQSEAVGNLLTGSMRLELAPMISDNFLGWLQRIFQVEAEERIQSRELFDDLQASLKDQSGKFVLP